MGPRNLIFTLILIQTAGLSVLAWAAGDRERGNRREREPTAFLARTEMRQAALTTLKGTLICNMGAENTGEACELKLAEHTTGQTYRLNNDTAMRLYQDGKREVAIVGRPTGESLQVQTIDSLE